MENQQPVKRDEKSGLLSGLDDLFRGKPSEAVPSTNRMRDLPASETQSKSSSGGEGLPAESERILDSVPNQVGGEPASEPGSNQEDMISALMASVAFEEQDVKDALAEIFDWAAEKFQSDHWRLTDRQLRIYGRPTAQLANSVWAKLTQMLPDVVAGWCETTPGLTAFIAATGIVVGPKVMVQARINQQRKEEKKKQGRTPEDQKRPSAKVSQPVDGGIAVATGIVGGN